MNIKKKAKRALIAKYAQIFGLLSAISISAFIATYFGRVPMLSTLARGIFYMTIASGYHFAAQAKAEWTAINEM